MQEQIVGKLLFNPPKCQEILSTNQDMMMQNEPKGCLQDKCRIVSE